MANAVTTFQDRPNRPTKFAKYFEERSNIRTTETVPSIGISGKTWSISMGGESHPVMTTDKDGDKMPAPTLSVIILGSSVRGRQYYAGAYDPNNTAQPNCWSDDCVTPSKHVDEPCAANCAACPMAAKGSRKTERNKDGVACQQYQLLAAVPAAQPDHEPLRLKLAITSIWDAQNKANDAAGWFAFDNYSKMLRAGGVQHTAEVITKMKFDPETEYPKILFFKNGWTSDETIDVLMPVLESPKVKAILGPSWTPNGVDGVKTGQISGPSEDEVAAKAKDVTPDPAVAAAAKKAAVKEAAAAELRAKLAALEAGDESESAEDGVAEALAAQAAEKARLDAEAAAAKAKAAAEAKAAAKAEILAKAADAQAAEKKAKADALRAQLAALEAGEVTEPQEVAETTKPKVTAKAVEAAAAPAVAPATGATKPLAGLLSAWASKS
jgi:hypothetical protein